MTGGPISNGRIMRDESGRATFWARTKSKSQRNRPRPFELSGKEFVRRDEPTVGDRMHNLPKGYTRSRCFCGYHGTKRKDYLNRCRDLLPAATPQPVKLPERIEPTVAKCPRCDVELNCIENHRRPSWKEIFQRRIHADPAIYSPMHHARTIGFPAFPHEPYG